MEEGAVVADALDFLDPEPIQFVVGGFGVEVEPLGLFDWLRFERSEERAIGLFLSFEFSQGIEWLVEAMEAASAYPFDLVSIGDALVAFVHLSEGNRCKYIDPYFVEATKNVASRADMLFQDELKSRAIFDVVMVLARRFSLGEIREIRPEMAFLSYQYLLDEQADDRTVSWVTSEVGYKKEMKGKGKSAKVKVTPIPSPFITPWLKLRERAANRARIEAAQAFAPHMSPLITHPEKVIDLSKRRRRDQDD